MRRSIPLFAILLLPCAASAHAFLKTAVPAVGSTVHGTPAQLVLDYTEGVEPSFSTIEVRDAGGTRVDTGSVHVEGGSTRLEIGLKPLAPGTYQVVWHVTAVDTHKTEGKFSFTVAP